MFTKLERWNDYFVVKEEDFQELLEAGHTDFRWCFFDSVDFMYFDGKKYSFENCKFNECDFKFADFDGCRMKSSDFHGCTMSNASFEATNFEECSFYSCSIDMCNLSLANMSHAFFEKSRIRMCNLSEINMLCCTFSRSWTNTVVMTTPVMHLDTVEFRCPGATSEECDRYKMEQRKQLTAS